MVLALFEIGGWTHCGVRQPPLLRLPPPSPRTLTCNSGVSRLQQVPHSCTAAHLSHPTFQYTHQAGIEHRMMNVSQGVRACAAAATEREEPQSVPWTGSLPAFPPSSLPSLQMLQRGLGHMLPSLQDSAQQKASSFGNCLAAAADCKHTSLAISDPQTAVASCRATRWSHSPFVADAPGDRQHYAQLLC